MNDRVRRVFSMISRGSRHHLAVAIALITVVPLLCFALIASTALRIDAADLFWFQLAIAVFALIAGLAGYAILRRYPANIEKLRDYLHDMAAGELPPNIQLMETEDDTSAIENYMNVIVGEMRRKLQLLEQQLEANRHMTKTIEAQEQEILDAERHRVMIESLGSACHHIGQPATVLRVYLDVLRDEVESEQARARIDKCRESAESIGEILETLRQISHYRTVPYQTFRREATRPDGQILDIDQE